MIEQDISSKDNPSQKFESLSVWCSDTSLFKNKWQVAIVPSNKVDISRLQSAFPTAKIECWKENPIRLYITPTKGGEPKSLVQVLDFLGAEGWEPYGMKGIIHLLKRSK
jgi:hypothetical protein